MPIKQCKLCTKDFYVKPYFLKIGNGKYCSSKCQYKGSKNGKIVGCFMCKKPTYRSKKDLESSKSGKYFCSKQCQTKWRNSLFIGAKHSNWKGGKNCYRSIMERHIGPKMCRLCKTSDKRILAVHHIDKDHFNNNLDNLAWLCHNCHHLVHHYKEEQDKFMVAIV